MNNSIQPVDGSSDFSVRHEITDQAALLSCLPLPDAWIDKSPPAYPKMALMLPGNTTAPISPIDFEMHPQRLAEINEMGAKQNSDDWDPLRDMFKQKQPPKWEKEYLTPYFPRNPYHAEIVGGTLPCFDEFEIPHDDQYATIFQHMGVTDLSVSLCIDIAQSIVSNKIDAIWATERLREMREDFRRTPIWFTPSDLGLRDPEKKLSLTVHMPPEVPAHGYCAPSDRTVIDDILSPVATQPPQYPGNYPRALRDTEIDAILASHKKRYAGWGTLD